MKYSEWSIADLKKEIQSLNESHQKMIDDANEEKIEAKKAHQERIVANSYTPNLAFEGLKYLLS